MAEAFLFNIAERVLEKIAYLSIEEARLAFNVETDLSELKETVSSIKAVLLDAEQKQHQNEKLRLCMWKLRNIFYDAEDVIDDFKCEALRKQDDNHIHPDNEKVRFSASCCFPISFSLKMGHKIKEINQRLNKLATEWNSFDLGQGSDIRRVFHRETHSFVHSSDVIGRDMDKENIIDDVWNENRVKWIELRDLLRSMGGLSQSRIIVTTRSMKVASIMSSTLPYELKGLPLEHCSTLFAKWAFSDDVSQKECKTVNHQTELIDRNVRHLSFSDEKLLKVPQLKKLKNVRTVIIHGVLEESLINLCVSKYKYLRVLRLCDSHLTALPSSIGILKHLRDLDLTNCRHIKKLPSSFCRLQSLQSLRMRGVPLLQLPDNLESLIELRYLEITIKAPHLKEIRSGCWPSLQYLAFHDCDNLKRLFEGMQHLTSLRGLVLDNCPNLVTLPQSLKFLTKLEDLCVSWCNKINLEMEPEEEEDRNLKLSLKTFLLSDSDGITDLPRLLLERSSSTLQQIKISNCSNFVVLPPWLQHLVAQNCQLYRREWTRSPNTRELPIFVIQI
ncbi:hypothetical protein V6N11_045848 [Hibiscus sabdariffa]|uniref:Rx N-terminal domain-containing protein n=1 Tax=Hibiscus sabdariffa TaxID=183260 RepID=A0ABR2Q263_9ROSI